MATQHFLVPIDFSEYADHALEYAMTLAGKLDARITLLHVLQSVALGGADMGVTLPYSYLETLEAEIRSTLESYRTRITAAGLEGTAVLVHGAPFHEIIEIAKAQQVDLIIMGTHGRTGFGHLFLGSVAEKVVRLAPCPVLVARQHPAVPAV